MHFGRPKCSLTLRDGPQGFAMFEKLLIANRGAIACRILRTLRELQVKGVAIYAEADAASLHIQHADEAYSLGEGAAATTYLAVEKILATAKACGARAIHPGYGFLSENAAFAQACEHAGIAFVGPTPEQLRVFGLKHTARALAKQHKIPLLEGTELLDSLDAALLAADTVGYPVMLKSTAGGGGIGMRVCRSAAQLSESFEAVKRLGQNNFSDAGVFIEKYIEHARHLEVQVFGDGAGDVIALGVRDCSVQRRNQKVLEETPAPNLPEGMAEALCAAAITLARAVNYRSAGTVEFIFDSADGRFYFLEVNTRLQVEHGVTEQVWGVDLVRWMVEMAAGELPPLSELDVKPGGHAIQARLYAEDPGRDFQPSPGLMTCVDFPAGDGLRIDTWVEAGCEIPPYFDPMIAKLIAWAPTREQARLDLHQALSDSQLYGVETNRDYLRQILLAAPFASGRPWTRCLEDLAYVANTFEVLSAGTQTSVQDYPGRLGYWAVGVPPSGPMDSRALRRGNRLLGNDDGAAALEITMSGPLLRFNCAAVVAVTGADIPLLLNEQPVPMNTALLIEAGAVLSLGTIAGAGARSYLCLRGGLQVPDYLGSKYLHPRPVRRPWWTGVARRGCVAPGAAAGRECWPAVPRRTAAAGAHAASDLRPPRRAGIFPAGVHRHLLCHAVGSAFQLQPYRRAVDRAQAIVGTYGRRGGGAASVEYPRQSLCHWRGGFYRRHAGDPRPGWPEPRRFRLPGDSDRGGPVAAGAAQGRRQGPLRAGRPQDRP